MTHKIRSIVAAAAGVALAGSLMASPAYAAGELATANIGSQPAVLISNTWADVNGDSHVITVTTNFSQHTTSTVNVDSIRICYSGPDWSSILISPYTRNEDGSAGNVWDSGPAVNLTKGAGQPAPCTEWTVGKTYSANASGEVVRVVSRITGDTAKLETIAAYYR